MNLRKNKIFVMLLLVLGALLFSNCTSFTKKVDEKGINEKVITAPAYQNSVIQNTNYGVVQGLKVNEEKTFLWKGIPYAKAERWKAPQNPDKWKGTLDATKAGNVGVQASKTGAIGSEDCLNLDIYRPNTAAENLPILLYIHGGNNQAGLSGEINADKLAVNANVIIVSINYRLGLLGFNNLPALKTGDKYEDSGNYTLLDIAESLDWIKENIASFGGNPQNITVSGFSAGGRDVMAMLISPIFKGKFQKAISFSGGMTLADSGKSQELFAKAIAPLVVADKVKSTEKEAYEWLLTSGEDVKNYLYSLSADRFAPLMSNAGIRMGVFPHLFNDGVVLPTEGYSTKNYNNVPLIMITGSSEFSLFGRFAPPFVAMKDEELLSNSEMAKNYAFIYKYGGKLYELFNAQESAERMFANYKAPIYTADFDFGTNTEVLDRRTTDIYGSLHGIWVPFLVDGVQGASGLIAGTLQSPGAKDLTVKFTKYISNFTWNTNPNSEGLTEWVSWKSAKTGPSQLILDADKEKAIIKMSERRANYKAILEEMENDKTISPENKKKMISEVLNGRWFSRELDEHFENSNDWVQVF